MAVRQANARWFGTLQDGNGTMKMTAWEGPFSFTSRFEEGEGTNPEELLAAAHAGCFSMALSAGLGRAGYPATSISTTAKVHLTKQEAGFRITKIELETEAKVPNISDEDFQKVAEATKTGCPVSVALGAVEEIVLKATLTN